jgi:hypothetical protein
MLDMRSTVLGLPGPRLGGTCVTGAVAVANAVAFLGRPRRLWRGPEVGLNSEF